MSDYVSVSIISEDIFEEIVKGTKYGQDLLKRISNDEFGPSVFVTNMTVVSILQRFDYNKKMTNRIKKLLYFLPQYDHRRKKKSSLIIEEPVSGQVWGEAVDWFVRYSASENKKMHLSLVNWADISLMKFILKMYKDESKTSYIVTKNNNYAKVAELSRNEKMFPKFQIIQ